MHENDTSLVRDMITLLSIRGPQYHFCLRELYVDTSVHHVVHCGGLVGYSAYRLSDNRSLTQLVGRGEVGAGVGVGGRHWLHNVHTIIIANRAQHVWEDPHMQLETQAIMYMLTG